MAIVNKAVVPVAAPKTNKFSLPSQHLTTSNFMQFNAAYSRQLVPNSHGKLKHKTFMRAQPLDKPCLGSATVHNRAFLVPYRVVWEPFNDFVLDVPHNTPNGTQLIPNVPRISNKILETFICQSSYSTNEGSTEPASYDFLCGGNYYTLLPSGRQAMKQLESLGYKIVFDAQGDVYFSALPLLCLAKVYMDYYYPSAYAHYGIYASIDGIMQRHVTYDLTVPELNLIFQILEQVCYDNDFFSAIWDSPVGPNDNVGSNDYIIRDLTVNNGGIVSSFVGNSSNSSLPNPDFTPVIRSIGSNGSTNTQTLQLSQYIVDSLKALTNYVKRHQLLGSRALDRALGEWGIALDADKLKRCYYLGEQSFPFEIADVMSNSDTSPSGGASLGAYAGKGLGYSGDSPFVVDFDTDEFGYLFVINSVVPDVSYPFGIDKNTMCLTKLDFLTHEFDALGPDLVTKAEVAVDMHNTNQWNTSIVNEGFGFAPRYYQFKIPYDRFTGDFRYGSINADLNSWSTMREFDYSQYGTAAVNFAHNLDFVFGKDALQYDRIFLGYSESLDPVDPFFVVHRDSLELYAPMKSLYDSYDWEEETSKTVTTEPNGVKMN